MAAVLRELRASPSEGTDCAPRARSSACRGNWIATNWNGVVTEAKSSPTRSCWCYSIRLARSSSGSYHVRTPPNWPRRFTRCRAKRTITNRICNSRRANTKAVRRSHAVRLAEHTLHCRRVKPSLVRALIHMPSPDDQPELLEQINAESRNDPGIHLSTRENCNGCSPETASNVLERERSSIDHRTDFS